MLKRLLNQNIFMIIAEILIIIVGVLGVTYAAIYATKLISANISTAPIDITWTGDNVLVGSNILPINATDISTKSISSAFTVKGVQSNPSNVYYDVSLRNIMISENLKSSDFKWQLYKDNTLLSSGSFSNIGDYNRIVLTSQILTLPLYNTDPDSYTIYIYIEESSANQNSLLNGTFRAELGVDLYTSNGGSTNRNVMTIESMYSDTSLASAPILADGMIPIAYDSTNEKWIKADKTNYLASWYNYDNKMWANAVLVTSETRENYMNANIGTEITESDILAYYVWVPRYKYKLWNVEFGETSPQEIDIVFESITDSISTGSVNNQYLSHPAFWWDNDSDGEREAGEELSGIWVGKFETTGDTTTPTILPNITSLRNQNVSTQFLTAQKLGTSTYLTTNGVNQIDSHMMKNMEWGAVAYLSHSKYGKNSEITINSTSGYITGGGTYKTNIAQSTTGNITGMYDMSSGAFENVMGVVQDNTNTNTPMSGNSTTYNSGFTGKLYESGSFTQYSGTVFPDKKYYDLYDYGTTYTGVDAYNRSHLGDATGETRGWYSDSAVFIYANSPWFIRGGRYDNGSFVGAFYFNYDSGSAFDRNSWRGVITNIK